MHLRIVRNDITKMNTEAIVNAANEQTTVGIGCDSAKLGDAFITPCFNLAAKYIIHVVSPLYPWVDEGDEEKLRSCYRKSLMLAKEYDIKSISFPLIPTGGFGYPKEEGMRIAVDEINAFLLDNDMDIFLVVFDTKSTELGEKLCSGLEAYIDHNYVETARKEEHRLNARTLEERTGGRVFRRGKKSDKNAIHQAPQAASFKIEELVESIEMGCPDFEEEHVSRLDERMKHMSDTFSEYLMYLIKDKKMENADVWKRAIIDKKVFSKIKNNPNYHPNKLTALCLCIGAMLNLDESKDLLARAGYALSPCDKTDIIFSYFIENKIYDMIELDIQLEEHGLPCIIS